MWLVTCGLVVAIAWKFSRFFATDFEEYRQINELILSGQRIESNVVIACADDTKEYDNIIPSKVPIQYWTWQELRRYSL